MDMSAATETNRPEIQPKIHFTVTVQKITLAGAILDIGVGTPAVLLIPQLKSPVEGQPIKSVRDVLAEGQSVDVWVRRVKEDHIEVTMIQPLALEWRDIKKDMVVKGTVTRIEKFGVFVEIGAERPGLIHISELAHGYVRTPTDVLQEGQEVEAMVIDVNRKKKQIKLSLKALLPEPVVEEEPAMPVEAAPKRERTKVVRRKSNRKERQGEGEDNTELLNLESKPPVEEEPTEMALAWQQAMERARSRKQGDKAKRKATPDAAQDDILSRTLENKIQS